MIFSFVVPSASSNSSFGSFSNKNNNGHANHTIRMILVLIVVSLCFSSSSPIIWYCHGWTTTSTTARHSPFVGTAIRSRQSTTTNIICFTRTIGASTSSSYSRHTSASTSKSNFINHMKDNDNNDDESSSSMSMNMKELSRRIQSLKEADAMEQNIQQQQTVNVEEQDATMTNNTNSKEVVVSKSTRAANLTRATSTTTPSILELPVIAFDSLLPNQRLSGTTTDPTFSRFLRDLGLGGMFVMTSVDPYKRLIRRNGVLARIEIVDAPAAPDMENDNGDCSDNNSTNEQSSSSFCPDTRSLSSIPTAVDFVIVGRYHCHIIGPTAQVMKRRIGRWRRAYDPDGEETRLGWGEERFLNMDNETTKAFLSSSVISDCENELEEQGKKEEWVWNKVKVMVVNNNNTNNKYENKTIIMETNNNNNTHYDDEVDEILKLLHTWEQLASNERTYDNIDVMASTRILKGHAGLSVDPKKLLHKVRQELGDLPSKKDYHALVFWIAALINPLPPLGVAPEIRGRVLEASPNVEQQLRIIKWALQKSIRNLQGKESL